MAPPKGHPRWGGRRKGTPSKAVQLRRDEIAQAIRRQRPVPDEVLQMSPIEVMGRIMRLRYAEGDLIGALAAASSLAPYLHPRLSMNDTTVRHEVANRSDAEIAAEIEAVRARIERAKLASLPPLIEARAEPTNDQHAALRQPTAEMPHRQAPDIPVPVEDEKAPDAV
jgi:hypothetical protein